MADIEAGSVPYLFGGPQRPCCRNCLADKERTRRSHSWPKFCRFEGSGPICSTGARKALVESYRRRKFEGPLTLSPCDFWPYIRGRTLWFFGDSQTLDFFKAMMCFHYEFWNGTLTNAGVTDPWLLSIMHKVLPSMCVHLPQGTRVCYVRVDTGDDLVDHLLPIVPEFARASDVAVINFGLHHGKGHGFTSGYASALDKFAKHMIQHRSGLPTLFWQQCPPQHFENERGTGEYHGGKPPFKCYPINYRLQDDGTLALNPGMRADSEQVLKGGWRNAAADTLMRRLRMPIIESWNESVPLWNMHRDNGQGHECTHNCHPGTPQT